MPNSACSSVGHRAPALARRRRRPAACTGCRRRARTSRRRPRAAPTGAKGRKTLAVLDLEVQHRLHGRRARIAEDRASAERARAELHAALEPADRLSVDERVARRRRSAASSSSTSKRAPAALQAPLDLVLREARARDRRRCMASPRAVRPCAAAPEAGDRRPAPRRARRRRRRRPAGSRCRSKRPSRRILPLATQLSATPPARQRFSLAGLARERRASSRSMTSSVTAWIEAARSMSRWVSSVLGLARRAAEQRVEPAVGHGQAGAVVEVVQVRGGTSRRP